MSTKPLITIENVSKRFQAGSGRNKGEITAVDNVNLNIEPGEIIAVVGESGCGKTTLGKLVAGIYEPTEGRILFEGKDIHKMRKSDYKDYRLSVQMVHQDSYAALNPNKTIFQSLSLPLLQHKMAKNDKEAVDILYAHFEEVGLTPPEIFLAKNPHQLSGGQRQRILLARALSVKPKLIVADEPVSMVDVSLRIALLNLMAEMNRKYDISFVYITHDLGTARYIARQGRLAVMYLGRMIELRSIENAINKPLHPYFQALIKAVPEGNPKYRAEEREKTLPLRSLDMPELLNLPEGCTFHPRCPYYLERCMKEVPPNYPIEEGSHVACFRLQDMMNGTITIENK